MAVSATTRAMLNELADFLDTLPPERFDYRVWVGNSWQGKPDLSCGTVACAAGWATTLPGWQESGLRLSMPVPGRAGTIVYRGDSELSEGPDAIAEALGISGGDALCLFVPHYIQYDDDGNKGDAAPAADAHPAEVAVHIRRWLERQS